MTVTPETKLAMKVPVETASAIAGAEVRAVSDVVELNEAVNTLFFPEVPGARKAGVETDESIAASCIDANLFTGTVDAVVNEATEGTIAAGVGCTVLLVGSTGGRGESRRDLKSIGQLEDACNGDAVALIVSTGTPL